MRTVSTTLSIILLCTCSSSSYAREPRVRQIPGVNPDAACNTCHTNGGGTALNVFGEAVATTFSEDDDDNVANNVVGWAELCDLDSDGDGARNGEELGDPTCVWTLDDAPAAGEDLSQWVSDPSDENSQPDGSDDGSDDGEPPVSGGEVTDDDGGCSTTGSGQAANLALWLALASGIWFANRRREIA